MKGKIYILILCSALLSINSCQKDKFEDYNSKNKLGSVYFPLNPGLYHTYKVKRIQFDAFNNKSDTFNLIVKNLQDTFFIDNLGRTAIRYVQMTRDSSATDWNSIRSYYFVGTNTHIEDVVENQRRIILTLPVIEESVWNYNTYNKEPQYLLHYNKEMESYSNGYISGNKSVEVNRLGRELPFEENYWREVYTQEIGLMSKYFTHIEYIDGKASGLKEEMELIEYGIEK